MKPPTFLGGIELLKAETWLLEMEKLFEVFPCSETQKVLLATYTLKDEARRWWLLIRTNNRNMTWIQFNEIFYDKYFPQCFRNRKVLEFQELMQARISIAKYEAKFIELAWFAPYIVDTDYKKARKFEGGLDLEMFDRVGVLKLPTYMEVLDRALMAEAILAAKKQVPAPTTELRGKKPGSNFRKGRSSFTNKKQNIGSSSISRQSNGSMSVCSKCGKKHKGMHYRVSGICFLCGKTGHMIRDYLLRFDNANCPTTSSAGSAPAMRTNARTNARGNTENETLRQGRVFVLMPGYVQNTKSVVLGIIPIYAQNAYVLIDSGSTHSFISYAFSRKLTRPLELMNCLLAVSTPSRGSMICAYVYPTCEIMTSDKILYVDLLPLRIYYFDCILGMDWLTKYYATIDCVSKFGIFRPLGMPKFVFVGNEIIPPLYLISFVKGKMFLRKRCRGYLCCVLNVTSDSSTVENIPIINEFSDVFPNELLGDLIDREIEFTIDVIPGTQPISKTPYKMSTSELKELKTKLQDLEEHKNHLRTALQILRENKLYAKLSKCESWLDNVAFLGHVINKEGKAYTIADAVSRKSMRNLSCLLTGQIELLCDLEKNEIEVVLNVLEILWQDAYIAKKLKTNINDLLLVDIYMNEIVRLHGVPISIISDRDSKFTSRFWQSLQQALKTKLRLSSANHRQTNGQSERTNHILEDMLRMCVLNFQEN
ncbi:uncharacterized protein LOC114282792 [Camellia sinensis]|uniref:uncharacterized protein LOC114282792 n=1 Tax=Camellia sinensis TaxID=4442 RepID=UPI0010363C59|nr:uncharacterized protein LOC114282792 [Camellia sinensis]